ncbi:DUF72 domain-containing protein [Fodinicurvata halophila]|uniref:DUF72 domain-containing protein n=1 Tax=Fodinicurvata halophila TaxID=1419723 RepID=A0ABV8UMX8_9PROT
MIHVGTSGWHYDHWVGPFYPEGMNSSDFLPFYAERFETVEINNTFYQLPDPETLARWRDATPAGFRFACKGSRYITHMKKLKDPQESTKRFFQVVEALDAKLGPILFQLPPRWRADVERLTSFLAALPDNGRYALEFRDESWFTPEIYDALDRAKAAFCIYDLAGTGTPVEVTGDFAYVRLHGPDESYNGSYSDQALSEWARRFRQWQAEGRDVYCFFNNDQEGHAARDAQRLKAMLAGQ